MVTKTGSIKTLIFRAYDLCTEIKDRNEELEFLKDTFIANDIPINIVDRIFQKYIPQKYRTDGEKIRKRHQLILKNLSKFRMKKDSLIYILKRELQKEGIHVIFSKGTTLEKKLCKLTPKKPIEESKHNITGNTAPNVVQHTLGNPV